MSHDAVGGEHDLRIVFDDHGASFLASRQALHTPMTPTHVARVQPI